LVSVKGKPHIFFLAPAILIITGVIIYPLVYVIWLSLHRRLLIFDISRFVGFDNFSFLLRDDRFWNALYNTVYFTAVSVAIELILGLSIAILLNRAFTGRGLMR
jgi:ABC-type sugar transport system permease subunit